MQYKKKISNINIQNIKKYKDPTFLLFVLFKTKLFRFKRNIHMICIAEGIDKKIIRNNFIS